jgi:cyclophilin family peptidyl-prolyl cis-trans isomerase
MHCVSRALASSLLAVVVLAWAVACAESAEEDGVPATEDSAIAKIEADIEAKKIDKARNRWKEQLPPFPVVEFDASKKYFWNLETNLGDIVIEFLPDVAPKHVSSTIYLTKLGFYDDVVFHRIIPRFMAQGGDPTGTGRGGPGYQYDGEFDIRRAKHDQPGILSMANAGPGTDGSQFFITFKAVPQLDGKHTVFGKVVEGMETVRELEERSVRRDERDRPLERLAIEKATIRVESKS